MSFDSFPAGLILVSTLVLLILTAIVWIDERERRRHIDELAAHTAAKHARRTARRC